MQLSKTGASWYIGQRYLLGDDLGGTGSNIHQHLYTFLTYLIRSNALADVTFANFHRLYSWFFNPWACPRVKVSSVDLLKCSVDGLNFSRNYRFKT
jgi:hypothetical protein